MTETEANQELEKYRGILNREARIISGAFEFHGEVQTVTQGLDGKLSITLRSFTGTRATLRIYPPTDLTVSTGWSPTPAPCEP